MEDLKHLAGQTNNVLQLSKALQKVEKAIEQQKKNAAKKESAIEELNFLKEQCLSKNIQLSLLSSQSLYNLVESGVLQPASVLTMFITMLSNANTPISMSIIGEGIINILLLDLKVATLNLRSNESYVCPFGMKTAQHPVITLMHKKNLDVLDLASKLDGICNHSNAQIRANSIQFLRPVFVYAFCNPIQMPNSNCIWSVLLKQQRVNTTKTQSLIQEIFTWCRITLERCLSLSTQLIETIEVHLEANNCQSALEYLSVNVALISSLIEFSCDPRNALNITFMTIQQNSGEIDDDTLDYMLITMSQIVRNIPPFYLRSALDIVKILIEQKRVGNIIINNMVLDSLIIRSAVNGKIIPVRLIEQLQKHKSESIEKAKIASPTKNVQGQSQKSSSSKSELQYSHPLIAMNFNLVRLCAELSSVTRTKMLRRLIKLANSNEEFRNEMHFFLRSILLSISENSDSDSLEIWTDIFPLVLSSKDNSHNTIYFMLYLLAKETDGRKQMELLRGLTSFTEVKENIPLILNTYRALSSSSSVLLQKISVALHTQLWIAENRTYKFLHKVLISDDEKLSVIDRWEMNIIKANAIKEICSEKASQHGTDLVAPLSKILNCSFDNDLASSLALDAVVLLCKSHTVNIVSTWKVLRGVFESELKFRTTKSLCEFFGEVPLLKSPTNEYDMLFREALSRLWNFIFNSKDVKIIRAALRALRNYDFQELTLQDVPHILFDNIKLPKEYQIEIAASLSDSENASLAMPYIPGECLSIELFHNIDPHALDDAVEFITHVIETEMSQYRSGIYILPEGRPEPKEFQHLHTRSPLRAMVKFLCEQLEHKSEPVTVVKCLECVAVKYSRPIPPINWFFLIEYINSGMKFKDCTANNQFKMKKYALMIAANQIAHSGSAKTIVENYLESFDASEKDLEETQMALELVPKICDGISPRILATFLRHTLTFLHGLPASSYIEKKNHLDIGIESILKTFDKKCLVFENVDIIIDETSRFYDSLSNSEVFILKLPSEILDRLSTPVEWTADNFKRSLNVRTKAISCQKTFSTTTNPWMWINSLIDNVSDPNDPIADNERKEELLMNISNLLMEWRNGTCLCEWVMYLLGKVQSNLNQDATKENVVRSLYSLDLYMFCIVVLGGGSIFINDDLNMHNRLLWLKKFPESLWLLSKRPIWATHMPRIFEFLYHLKTQQIHMPKEYNAIICNALIICKDNEYFLQKSIWTKFISLR